MKVSFDGNICSGRKMWAQETQRVLKSQKLKMSMIYGCTPVTPVAINSL